MARVDPEKVDLDDFDVVSQAHTELLAKIESLADRVSFLCAAEQALLTSSPRISAHSDMLSSMRIALRGMVDNQRALEILHDRVMKHRGLTAIEIPAGSEEIIRNALEYSIAERQRQLEDLRRQQEQGRVQDGFGPAVAATILEHEAWLANARSQFAKLPGEIRPEPGAVVPAHRQIASVSAWRERASHRKLEGNGTG